jgi:hypothetical protein
LRPYLKEKLDGTQFFLLMYLHQQAMTCESRSKETSKSASHKMHLVGYDNSDDESTDVYTTELVWPRQAKPSACSALQSIQKNQREEVKFTFNVAKCDKIFDELLKNGNIKLTHTIPPPDELKRCAYCKWHNYFSHATNDCNVFRRQIQSVINEGRLVFQEMEVDTQPFPVNTIELTCEKVLVWPKMANKGKDKGIIMGDPCISNISKKEITQKAPDEKAKRSGGAEGQAQLMNRTRQPGPSIADSPTPTFRRSGAQIDGPANSIGQSVYDRRRQPLHKARKKTQGQSTYGQLIKADPTFDQLLSKIASKKTVPHDRSTKKLRSPAKTKWPNKTTQKVTRQASPVHSMRLGYFPPICSSSVYCPAQMWNGTCIVPLSIQAGGYPHSIHFDPLINWSWPRKIQSKMAFIHWYFIE